MATAKDGDTVKIHYKGFFDGGEVFDSSEGREPLEFAVGGGQVIPGFEQGVTGMAEGEKKTINIPAAEAYGEYRDDMVQEVERSQFPPDAELKPGQMFQVDTPGGPMPVTVKAVVGDKVTLDANHAMAGKDLNFDLELVSIG
jgi:FKBP-type peptidyl-prolyl cis-trans isomerase 2